MRPSRPVTPSKPPWIRVRLPHGTAYGRLKRLKERKSLNTVCEAAQCPNMGRCWDQGHATFLILGNVCTRDCTFCNVRSGIPRAVDQGEPVRVAQAVVDMALKHAVITSVTRDDLPDKGASLFAATIRRVREASPRTTVEVLIPDFQGQEVALAAVVAAGPDILGHNLETVPRLYPTVRPGAVYRRSLEVLSSAKKRAGSLVTKSGIMVGLGETRPELLEVMADLRETGCDVLTIGQYLRPTRYHTPVNRYYDPDEFASLAGRGRAAGFRWVEAGPLVRSSYGAGAQARALIGRQGSGPVVSPS